MVRGFTLRAADGNGVLQSCILDDFRVELHLPSGTRINAGKRYRSVFTEHGVLLVFNEGSKALDFEDCRRCAPCRCRDADDVGEICRICTLGCCRRAGKHGHGAWGRALRRGFAVDRVEHGPFGDYLTLSDFRVDLDARVLGGLRLHELIGHPIVGILSPSAKVLLGPRLPMNEELRTTFISTCEAIND